MDNRKTLVETHFAELANMYPDLNLEHTNGISVVRGLIDFRVPYEGTTVHDSYQIELIIPADYPDTPPVAKETGGRIPQDFHHYADPYNFLCLAVPIEYRMKFADNPSLVGFVKDLLVHYLFAFSYYEHHGVMPYGERSHGCKGIMAYYVDVFNVNSETIILNFLKILSTHNYRGHHECPCGSGKIIRQCHGEILLKLHSSQSQDEFLYNFIQCADYLKKSEKDFPETLLDKKFLKLLKRSIKSSNVNEKRGIGGP